jgi:hypothetical protein
MPPRQARQTVQRQQIGVSPTNSQKLLYITNKLGLTGIKDMQGASVNIYDTVRIVTSTGRQSVKFFETTSNKSLNFTNFQNGSLNSGETLIMEKMKFLLLELSATDLNSDATYVTNMWTFAAVPDTGVVGNRSALKLGLININIANSTVTKTFLITETDPTLNRQTTGISPGNLAADAGTLVPFDAIYGPSTLHMEAPPVLPPNQKVTVELQLPPVGTLTGNLAIMCIIGDFGSIFSAKTPL